MAASTIVVYLPHLTYDYEVDFFRRVRRACTSLGVDLIFLGLSQRGGVKDELQIYEVPWSIPQTASPVALPDGPNRIDPLTVIKRELEWAERAWPSSASSDWPSNGVRWLEMCFEQLASITRPNAAVLWGGEYAVQLPLREVLRRLRIPMAFIERGLLSGTLFFDRLGISASSSFVIGDGPSRPTDNREEIFDFEAYREYYLKGGKSWWDQPDRESPEEIRSRLGIRANQKVIFFPGQVDGDTANFIFSPHFESNCSAFAWLCDKFKGRDEYFILGKHHPKSSTDTKLFEKHLSLNGKWIADVAVQDCLSVSDYVALVNSTVALEAALHEKPTLSLGNSLLTGSDILYEVKDPERAEQDIADWLGKVDFEKRLERFRQFIARLVSSHLFAYDDNLLTFGLRSAEDFARTLSLFAMDSKRDVSDALHSALWLWSLSVTGRAEWNGSRLPTQEISGRWLAKCLMAKVMARIRSYFV